jgi:hypothetical protein
MKKILYEIFLLFFMNYKFYIIPPIKFDNTPI